MNRKRSVRQPFFQKRTVLEDMSNFYDERERWDFLPPLDHRETIQGIEKNFIFKWQHKKSLMVNSGGYGQKISILKQLNRQIKSSKLMPRKATIPVKYDIELRKWDQIENLRMPLNENECLRCTLQRESSGFMDLNTIYRLINDEDHRLIMAAQRSAGGFTEYIISRSGKLISQENKKYIGKLKANFFSTRWVLTCLYIHELNSHKEADTVKDEAIINISKQNNEKQIELFVAGTDDYGRREEYGEDTMEKAINKEKNRFIRYRQQNDPKKNLLTSSSQLLVLETPDGTCLRLQRKSETDFHVEIRAGLSPVQAFATCLAYLDKQIFFS